jgi:uncharacterized membrane protein YkoI
MKKKYCSIMGLAMAGVVGLATSTMAAESEAELMKQAKISKAQAEKIALAKVPTGKIQSEEIENEHHTLVWSFDIVKRGTNNVTEVLVNAKTGKIVSINQETPGDQAKEKAADQANGQK